MQQFDINKGSYPFGIVEVPISELRLYPSIQTNWQPPRPFSDFVALGEQRRRERSRILKGVKK